MLQNNENRFSRVERLFTVDPSLNELLYNFSFWIPQCFMFSKLFWSIHMENVNEASFAKSTACALVMRTAVYFSWIYLVSPFPYTHVANNKAI